MLDAMSINRPELAAVLRRARERVLPEHVGLPAGRNRRTPGLRREEVAMLAGISVDYVVRLEQGRGPVPSAQVLGALTRALRLDDDARDELFHLAGARPPGPGRVQTHVRPSMLRLIDRFADLPAVVLSAKGDVLAWNAMSSALSGDWSALPPERRNLHRLLFLPDPDDPPRSSVGTTAEERRGTMVHMVAGLRAARARYPDDPDLTTLLDDLRAGSTEFAELWETEQAGGWRSLRKTVVHPTLGPLVLDCETLQVPDADQVVIVYSAVPGTAEAEALALLRVLGTQSMQPTEA
jgi:transcriptional regulator with XRE-family HTH domain